MDLAAETIIHLSEEQARRLSQLAAARGVTQEALVAEALDRLFQNSELTGEDSDDAEVLRRIEAELGPLPPVQTISAIRPEEIVSVIPVPIRPELIRRQGGKG